MTTVVSPELAQSQGISILALENCRDWNTMMHRQYHKDADPKKHPSRYSEQAKALQATIDALS